VTQRAPVPGTSLVAPPAPVVPGSIGVLGGTFDPIQHGHLAIAEEARETLGLERVLVIPAADPPHKPGRPVLAAEDRLAMARLAVEGNAALAVDDLEVRRGGLSYSVDTLQALCADGATDLWFILSSEALAGFAAWREPDRILDLCRLAVVPRDGAPPLDPSWVRATFPGREDRVRFLDGPMLPISGSVIRRRVAAGRSVRYLVPEPVARYIADHRLYSELARRTPTS